MFFLIKKSQKVVKQNLLPIMLKIISSLIGNNCRYNQYFYDIQ